MKTKSEVIERLNAYIDNLTKFRNTISEQLEEGTENDEFEFNWVEGEYDGYEVDYCLNNGLNMFLMKRTKLFKKSTQMKPVEVNGETLYRKIETVKENGYTHWQGIEFENRE